MAIMGLSIARCCNSKPDPHHWKRTLAEHMAVLCDHVGNPSLDQAVTCRVSGMLSEE